MDGNTSENGVLDVKPLRSLAPMFPTPFGFNAVTVPGPRPYVCVSPVAPFNSGAGAPTFHNFAFPNGPNNGPGGSGNPAPVHVNNGEAVNSPAGGNAVPNESSPARRTSGRVTRSGGNGVVHSVENADLKNAADPMSTASSLQTPPRMVTPLNEDDSAMTGSGISASGRKIKRPIHLSSYSTGGTDGEGSDVKTPPLKRKHRGKKLAVDNFESPLSTSLDDPRQSVEVILMTYDGLRRRLQQLDEMSNVNRRPDLRASTIMMSNGLRVNTDKRIGRVPGTEVGDIFYFRMEMCVVGLHFPSMAGIDYMTAKFDDGEDPVAISVVSSGGYENEEEDADVLIYSGQGGGGGGNKNDKKPMDDQKLERGNLALQKSLYRKNEIRVFRSVKDYSVMNGKIYIYDGLYKIHNSWVDKAKSGFNVFKYKLQREPGQPDGIAVWKMTQKWIDNPSTRGRVILPDISSGVENIPVSLVNEVDDEKGPGHFTYVTAVKYSKPIDDSKSLRSCMCLSVCLPGDDSCSCASLNGGNLPYNSTGYLVSRTHLVHECNDTCQCSVNCRNRVTQKGIKLHFEIFKTRDKGWGLRAWEPIRAGTFICEYVGEVVDKTEVEDDGEENEYMFQASSHNDKVLQWNYVPELLGEPSSSDSNETPNTLPFIISAKRMGNVSRFMNHSCSPNAFWQPLQHDHGDDGYPHIMFFAINHIPPMTELTYDYGLSGAESGGAHVRSLKKCLCGASKCRGFFQ